MINIEIIRRNVNIAESSESMFNEFSHQIIIDQYIFIGQ